MKAVLKLWVSRISETYISGLSAVLVSPWSNHFCSVMTLQPVTSCPPWALSHHEGWSPAAPWSAQWCLSGAVTSVHIKALTDHRCLFCSTYERVSCMSAMLDLSGEISFCHLPDLHTTHPLQGILDFDQMIYQTFDLCCSALCDECFYLSSPRFKGRCRAIAIRDEAFCIFCSVPGEVRSIFSLFLWHTESHPFYF